ncbi:MAG: hypothetical protein JWR74_2003 [Polaromonas sp.]|nr:hypothetical protein [Polaromonas sp.]
MNTTKEILLSEHDGGWGNELPVTLLTYEDGTQDLHRQTGEDFTAAIEKARALLWVRGLAVGPIEMIGPTGARMPVKPLAATNESTT